MNFKNVGLNKNLCVFWVSFGANSTATKKHHFQEIKPFTLIPKNAAIIFAAKNLKTFI